MKTKHTESIFNKINSYSDIVQAMVDGVRKEWVKIDMGTFGDFRIEKSFFGLIKKKVCYGCAATNTLCQLMGESFSPQNVGDTKLRVGKVNYGITYEDLREFENAVDHLRSGQIWESLHYLAYIENQLEFSPLDIAKKVIEVAEELPERLPNMTSRNEFQLRAYEVFAERLRAKGL